MNAPNKDADVDTAEDADRVLAMIRDGDEDALEQYSRERNEREREWDLGEGKIGV